MSKLEKNTLAPELRFPEFESYGEWGTSTLGELAKRITKKNKGNKITRVLTNSAIDGVVDQRDYFDKDIANKGNLDGYFIVDKGDYVYNPRISTCAPVGPISKNKLGKGIMSPLYTVFRFNNANNDFFEQFFKSTHWYHYLQIVSNSGARHDRISISTNDFGNMPLPEPKPKEQQKIADCLSSIDELITAQNQKIDSLKAHKKGLMQKIFPAEGETVPKLRFPEFRDAGEWEAKKIDQISETITAGGTPNTSEKNYWGGTIKWMNSGELNNKKVHDVQGRITEEGLRNSSTKKIPKMCVLIGLAGQGKTRGTIAMNMVELCTNQSIAAIFPNEESFSSDFIYHNLDNRYDELRNLSTGAEGRGGLNLKIIKSLEVPLPRIKEQQKIADCLSSIDELITAQTQKIETLKAHKKGLMQQLFLAVDEVGA